MSSVFSDGRHRFTIDLVDEFLAHRTYQQPFCLKLFELAKSAAVSWDVRLMATLMAEHQILKLQPDKLKEFDVLLSELRLKRPGLQNPIASSVLREGYSTTELQRVCGPVSAYGSLIGSSASDDSRPSRKQTANHAIREFINTHAVIVSGSPATCLRQTTSFAKCCGT